MVKKFKAIIIILDVSFLAEMVLTAGVYASNGTRFIGFSARDSAMAGATTASPEDTSCLIKNPAGLLESGNRIDAEYLNIIPHDVTMHTEGPVNPLLGVPLPNAGLRQKSTIDYIPGGNAGVSYRLPGTGEHPVAVGCGLFTMCGVAVNFPSSRINSALTGDYDKMVDLRSMRIAPGMGVGLTDKLSFGVTGNFEIQALRSNLATSTFTVGHYIETVGGGNWDYAPGGGFTLGLLYKFNDVLNFGTSYESHTWMGHHYKYKDVLPYIDEPPVINAGIAYKPTKNFELTFDTRYINWTDVKLARIKPNEGGFGWQDQWVFATGGEYTYRDKLKLRLGYNYGKSPIQSRVIFANALFPLITEHHLTTGISYPITKNLSFDLTWVHVFFAAKADNGLGDTYSRSGVGTKITAAADVIDIGLGYRF